MSAKQQPFEDKLKCFSLSMQDILKPINPILSNALFYSASIESNISRVDIIDLTKDLLNLSSVNHNYISISIYKTK